MKEEVKQNGKFGKEMMKKEEMIVEIRFLIEEAGEINCG